ncbi:MAG TPA: hypothetical protein ENN64_00415, partial [bacterium]|nr:hypothetical protein [bacterium]
GKWSSTPLDFLIISGDKDLLQLVSDKVAVGLPAGSFRQMKIYDRETVREKYGYYPEQIVDYKAMVGDSSDNIPGVKGIGDKSALELLEKYDTLEGIYSNIDNIKPRWKNLLNESAEQAGLSRELAEIDREAPISVDLEDCLMRDFSRVDVENVFRKYEFRSLMNKIPGTVNEEKNENNGKTAQLDMFISSNTVKAGSEKGSSKDEERKIDYVSNEILSKSEILGVIYLSPEEVLSDNEALLCRYSLERVEKSGVIHNSEYKNILYKCFTAEAGKKNRETFFYGWEKFVSRLSQGGENPFLGLIKKGSMFFDKVWDISLFEHYMDSGRKSYIFSDLVFYNSKRSFPKKLDISGLDEIVEALFLVGREQKKRLESFVERSSVYGKKIFAFREDTFSRILKNFSDFEGNSREKDISAHENNDPNKDTNFETDKKHNSVLIFPEFFVRNIENRISVEIAFMENNGIKMDKEALLKIKEDLESGIEKVSKLAYESVGHEFNLSSPKQLSEVIYGELNLPQLRSGKSGLSTKESILEELESYHPLISHVLEYRQLTKMLSTYVTPYLEILDGEGKNQIMNVDSKNLPNSRSDNGDVIYSDFNQTGTSSGRFSSQKPNLQNIPIQGEWADKLRDAFISRDGSKFVSVDYSQIESRLMASFSGDELLIADFIGGKDVHTATASRIFDKDESEVSKEERRVGKTINFAVLYGQTSFGLSNQLKISRQDGEKYINDYFNTYKGVENYIGKIGKFVKSNGYVETIFGRRRYIKGIESRNWSIRQSSIREAINMPIQGSASDIMR